VLKQLHLPGHPLILLDEVDSTNNYATRLLTHQKLDEGTVILTFRQSKGRGNGKNVWESDDFKNLTFSLILYPRFIPASFQFHLSQVISLGIFDFLKSVTDGAAIKWPNDLLIHRKKTAGILIENTVMGSQLYSSVIGIGMNVNQSVFPDHLPAATSLFLETGKISDLADTCQKVLHEIMKWYRLLETGKQDYVEQSYLSNLFGMRRKMKFLKKGQPFEATITGIDRFGQLLLQSDSGEISAFPFKSVEFIL
jgi:BirA family biotin operon repressor/biotin-[acetyl-CoA-carboxylase] ligase